MEDDLTVIAFFVGILPGIPSGKIMALSDTHLVFGIYFSRRVFPVQAHQRIFMMIRAACCAVLGMVQLDVGTMPHQIGRGKAHGMEGKPHPVGDRNALREGASHPVHLNIRKVSFQSVDKADLLRDPRDRAGVRTLIRLFDLHFTDQAVLAGQPEISLSDAVFQREDRCRLPGTVADRDPDMISEFNGGKMADHKFVRVRLLCIRKRCRLNLHVSCGSLIEMPVKPHLAVFDIVQVTDTPCFLVHAPVIGIK